MASPDNIQWISKLDVNQLGQNISEARFQLGLLSLSDGDGDGEGMEMD